ncbi:TetR/AcrR family transcriptional regulator [Amycolatopsis sp. CA-230715]|uniref:TetR/AcrR family transcriptional regulator n=1 Tax=Amycolatopsis sp. CA-230715 TaxID=2745196 RepID=UPI001C01F93D|nr:TetR/AcrR family transcriptional regulator [Amycolatopsis sp. CA-230715]QWF80753.1 hypothetical protein HUW46_04177 [Amycolatopsis sp. CA-230715]
MARWEPNAHERLASAAIELFLQQGYENTAVAEIAERAGLTKSTFFRHFTDKREVLFGRDELSRLLAGAITAAPASATPIGAIGAALDAAAAVFGPERRDWARNRQAVITATSELRERELLKRASLVEAMTGAMRERGVRDPVAGLAAEFGYLAFENAFKRWIDPAGRDAFGEVAREELESLREAITELG